MTAVRPFDVFDLFRFNNTNLDPFTETYGFNFYLQYLINHGEYFQVYEHPNGEIMGYGEFPSPHAALKMPENGRCCNEVTS
ncbi:unnamed protein product [Gongylonema pulchrum]|uniref:Acetyltransferase n=1 Tax=Gongylonema pulchrum TaxID=637853 RepID=A0A183ELD0_9BILA|nr:unnamed protein product [Gongylonema pulchrum]